MDPQIKVARQLVRAAVDLPRKTANPDWVMKVGRLMRRAAGLLAQKLPPATDGVVVSFYEGPLHGHSIAMPLGVDVEYVEVRLPAVNPRLVERYGPHPLKPGELHRMWDETRPPREITIGGMAIRLDERVPAGRIRVEDSKTGKLLAAFELPEDRA